MEVKIDLATIRDENSISCIEALFMELIQFFEEARDVEDDARSDDVDAGGVHKAYDSVLERGSFKNI